MKLNQTGKYKINIITIKGKNDTRYSGENLAKILNQSKFCIATKSIYNYLLMKYFEISACKSIIIGDMSDQGKKIWKDNFIEINMQLSDNEIIKIIDESLIKYNSKDMAMMQKIDRMYNIVQKEYNLKQYKEKIYRLITS